MLFSGWTDIAISKIPLDQEITAADSREAHKVRSILEALHHAERGDAQVDTADRGGENLHRRLECGRRVSTASTVAT